MKRIIPLLILPIVSFSLFAQTPPAAPPATESPAARMGNEVAVGGQLSSVDGDESVFRELNEGEQEGVFLEVLRMSGTTGNGEWTLDSRFDTGRSGWFDLSGRFGLWTTGIEFNQQTNWSAESFANEFLPSGTPVDLLFPGTTRLDPLFGVDDPNLTRRRLNAFAFRRFGVANAIGIRLRQTDVDGERVPNIGGASFSDLGTPAFYTAGLHRRDDDVTVVSIEGRIAAGTLTTGFDVAMWQRDTREAFELPAYGAASLLDLNFWEEGIDDDMRRVRADAAWQLNRRIGFQGGLSWYEGDGNLIGSDARVGTDGSIARSGLELTGGDVEYSGNAAALGVVVQPLERWTIVVAGDTRERSSEANGALLRRGVDFAEAASDLSESRIGATIDARGGFGRTRVRLRSRLSATENDVVETRGGFLEDLTREIDRTEVRAELSHELRRNVRLRLSGRLRSDETDVELHALDDGFVAGDWTRDETAASIELAFGRPARRTTLAFTTSAIDIDNGAPFVDPVFDPSVPIFGEDASVSMQRLTASSLWGFGRTTVWAEAGWIESEYDFDADLAQPGFAPISETIRGLVALAGVDWHPWERGRLSSTFELVRDSGDLDRTLTRGRVEAFHEIRPRLGVFGRWTGGDFENELAPSDDHTVHLFAAGMNVNF